MAKHIILPSLLLAALIVFLAACGDPHSFKKAENAQDAGREFIRASLDGNYEKASFYLYLDSSQQNKMMLDKWKRDYERLPDDERGKYKEADILPINIRNSSDSVTFYTYANSYKKDTTTIRIVRVDGEWLVDLKEIIKPMIR
jgi:Flp pilus assembly protein TadD